MTSYAFTISSRTFEGRKVDIKEVPFIVIITSDAGVCTGFLVDVRWVITAAHCLENTIDVTIAIGGNDVDIPTRFFTAEKAIFHPEYYLSNNDIVLLKLKMSVKLHDYAQIIAVDSVGWPNDSVTRRKCYVVGYGFHKKINHSGELHGGQVSIGHGRFYDWNCTLARMMISANLYWSYYNESEHLCHGDSGAPLICDNVAVGVAVAIFPCKHSLNPCNEKNVATYVILYEKLKWMKSYITCLPKCNCNINTMPSTVYLILFVFYMCIF
ncbi:hypothetical protein O3M35_005053 [Rhynocoris fuscipes]|uniref:Peptidase S1 domain-containing protein n=1 Tax=Rhynocoris fuscipes TaxID=488301 RepID=A0AAW1DJ85_9HEMI